MGTSGALITRSSYSIYLDKVTENADHFRAKGYGGCVDQDKDVGLRLPDYAVLRLL